MSMALAARFVEATSTHDFRAVEGLLDSDVETVTPRGEVRGIAACSEVLQKAGGADEYALEQGEPSFEEVDGDVIARIPETARWRESGEVAFEREFAVRLSFADEKIVRIVVMPGGAPKA